MNIVKTLFAQVMDFAPWKPFGRIVQCHNGGAGVRTLSCADLFRVMAFSQLTWRESLRDIEVCLGANHATLFHMGIKNVPARSTLADAIKPFSSTGTTPSRTIPRTCDSFDSKTQLMAKT